VRDERAANCGCGTVSDRRRARRPICPDTSDTQPGRERPSAIRARDRDRGQARGVAHAPAAPHLLTADVAAVKRAAQNAAHRSHANPLAINDIRTSRIRAATRSWNTTFTRLPLELGGTLLPGLRSPYFSHRAHYAEPTKGVRC
jgi:hypothetical protein